MRQVEEMSVACFGMYSPKHQTTQLPANQNPEQLNGKSKRQMTE